MYDTISTEVLTTVIDLENADVEALTQINLLRRRPNYVVINHWVCSQSRTFYHANPMKTWYYFVAPACSLPIT